MSENKSELDKLQNNYRDLCGWDSKKHGTSPFVQAEKDNERFLKAVNKGWLISFDWRSASAVKTENFAKSEIVGCRTLTEVLDAIEESESRDSETNALSGCMECSWLGSVIYQYCSSCLEAQQGANEAIPADSAWQPKETVAEKGKVTASDVARIAGKYTIDPVAAFIGSVQKEERERDLFAQIIYIREAVVNDPVVRYDLKMELVTILDEIADCFKVL